ncbi:MAG: DMT family transporter [Raoultibacter sp.]
MQAQGAQNHMIRGIICALIGATCWGFSGTCAQMLMDLQGVPVFWITCVRLLGAALLFFIVIMVRDRRALAAVLRDWRSLVAIFAFALLGVLLTQISYLSAISYTNAGTGTVLERLGLIVIMCYMCVRTRRLPRLKEFLGLVLAIGGTFVIATQGDFGNLAIAPEGLFWGLVSGFALACYTLIPVKVLEKWGAIIVTGLAMFSGGSVATVLIQPWTIPVELTAGVVGGMVAIILVGTLGAYIFYLQGITDAGPVKASLIGCVEPISATFFACVWLGTEITAWDILGCAMIIGMVFMVTQRTPSTAKVPAAEGAWSPTEGITSPEGVGASELCEQENDQTDAPIFRGRASVLGYLTSRSAELDDVQAMEGILADGRALLASQGVKQGLKHYPSSQRLMRSIKEGDCYIVQDEKGNTIGLFNVTLTGDPWYDKIYDGSWQSNSSSQAATYGVLRWMTVKASARRSGVGMFILGEADRIARAAGKTSMRADSYEGNVPVHRLLLHHGYELCGTIRAETQFEGPKKRVCFERLL